MKVFETIDKQAQVKNLIGTLSHDFEIDYSATAFSSFPFSNETGYWKIIEDLKLIHLEKGDKLKVALLFGESNVLSLLPALSNKVDLVLLADIEPNMHRHTKHLLACIEKSDTPEQFIKNYRDQNPIENIKTGSPDNLLVADIEILTELLTGSQGYTKKSLVHHHFLYNQEKYSECKVAAKNISFLQINLNLSDETQCQKLANVFLSQQADLALCNVSNIHHYVDHTKLSTSIHLLLGNYPHCFFMYAAGKKGDFLKAVLTTDLSDYFTSCLGKPYAGARQQRIPTAPLSAEKSCYVGLFSYDFHTPRDIEIGTIEELLKSDSQKNINDFSTLLHAHDTYEEAEDFMRDTFKKLNKKECPYWILTIRGDKDFVNALLRYRDHATGNWIHYPIEYDGAGEVLQDRLIHATNNLKTITLEKQKQSPSIELDLKDPPHTLDSRPTDALTQEKFCFIGGIAAQAVCLDLIERGISPEKLILVSAPVWMEKIHPSWSERPWTQSMRYLPPAAKKIAKRLFPEYPETDNMNCGMMQQIVMEQRRLLSTLGVQMISAHVESITHSKDGVTYSLGGQEYILTKTPNVHFFHAGRVPRSPGELSIRSFGNIHAQSVSETHGNIFAMVGSGTILDWAFLDFSLSKIVHLIPPGHRTRPDLASLLYASFHLNDIECQKQPDGTLLIEGINLIDGMKMQISLSQEQVYSAMGEVVDQGLIKAESHRVTLIDSSAKRESIERLHSFWGTSTSTKPTDARGSMLPNGNFNHCYHTILSAALNYLGQPEAYPVNDVFAIMFMDGWRPVIEEKAKSAGIQINPGFYEILFTRIKHCVTDSIPQERQIWHAIQSAFEQGLTNELGSRVPVAIFADGSTVSWEQFSTILNKTLPAVVQGPKLKKIIHLDQRHGAPLEDAKILDEETAASQFMLAQEIKKYYALGYPILAEGLYEDHFHHNFPAYMLAEAKETFPQGLPKTFAELNRKQMLFFEDHGAEIALLCLGEIDVLYQTAHPELKKRNRRFVAEWKKASKSAKSEAKFLAKKENLDFLFNTRELDAIQCAQEVAIRTNSNTVVIIFGADHDFNKHCKELGLEHELVETVKFIPQLQAYAAIDKLADQRSIKFDASSQYILDEKLSTLLPPTILKSRMYYAMLAYNNLAERFYAATKNIQNTPSNSAVPTPDIKASVQNSSSGTDSRKLQKSVRFDVNSSPAAISTSSVTPSTAASVSSPVKPVGTTPVLSSSSQPKLSGVLGHEVRTTKSAPPPVVTHEQPFKMQGDYSAFPSKPDLLKLQEAAHPQLHKEAHKIANKLTTGLSMPEDKRMRLSTRLNELLDHAEQYKRVGGQEVTHFFDRQYLDSKVYGKTVTQVASTPIGSNQPLKEALGQIGKSAVNAAKGMVPAIAGTAGSLGAEYVAKSFGLSEGMTDAAKTITATAATGMAATLLNFTPMGRATYMAMVATGHVADILAKHEPSLLNPALSATHPQNSAVKATVGAAQAFNDATKTVFSAAVGVATGIGEWATTRPKEAGILPSIATTVASHVAEAVSQPLSDLGEHAKKVFSAVGDAVTHVDEKEVWGAKTAAAAKSNPEPTSAASTSIPTSAHQTPKQTPTSRQTPMPSAASKDKPYLGPQSNLSKEKHGDTPTKVPPAAQVTPKKPDDPTSPPPKKREPKRPDPNESFYAKPLPPPRQISAPAQNFVNHLWAQKKFESPFESAIDRLRTQNAFSFAPTGSTSVVSANNYLSQRNAYPLLDQQRSSFFSPNWFDKPRSFLERSLYLSDFTNQARAELERQSYYGNSYQGAYEKLQSTFGRHFAVNDFKSLVRMSGLVPSYNSSGVNMWSTIPTLGSLRGEIGGVGVNAGVIAGLDATLIDQLLQKPRFFLQTESETLPFSDDELHQIIAELCQGIFVQHTYPFVSLEIAKEDQKAKGLNSVLHPAYGDTLVGEIITKLDYQMKGYSTGGFFTDEFLEAWLKNPSLEHHYLKQHMIDLRKYCRENNVGFEYTSMDELKFRLGLEHSPLHKETNEHSIYLTKFMTSFRIIAKLNKCQFDPVKNIFVIGSDFDVFTDSDLMPDYAQFLEEYKRQHDTYPADYLALMEFYQNMRQIIHDEMPKIPFFKKYFEQLKIISFFCYFLNTVKRMGIEPNLKPGTKIKKASVPVLFPPLPRRYFKYYPFKIFFKDILKNMDATGRTLFNKHLQQMFGNLEAQISAELNKHILPAIEKRLFEQVPVAAKNDDLLIYQGKIDAIMSSFQTIFKSTIREHKEGIIEVLTTIATKDKLPLAKNWHSGKTLDEIYKILEDAFLKKHEEDVKKINTETGGAYIRSKKEDEKIIKEVISEYEKQIQAKFDQLPPAERNLAENKAKLKEKLAKAKKTLEDIHEAWLAKPSAYIKLEGNLQVTDRKDTYESILTIQDSLEEEKKKSTVNLIN